MPRLRISIATVMMLVLTAASASALFARVLALLAKSLTVPFHNRDLAAILILAIGLTGVALAARKGHTANQAMLQITLSCLGFLYVIGVGEMGLERFQLYWLQILFAILVVGPLVARRAVKSRFDRGPRRSWWLGTCEAIAFAYLNMLLVLAGIGIEASVTLAFR